MEQEKPDNPLDVVTFYRPVGKAELDLFAAASYQRFPPRLPDQPIFYPVLLETYAHQIAKEWNTQDTVNGKVGFVTRFNVDRQYLEQFDLQRVGGNEHLEYWIPADQLETFNRHLVGPIEVITTYRG